MGQKKFAVGLMGVDNRTIPFLLLSDAATANLGGSTMSPPHSHATYTCSAVLRIFLVVAVCLVYVYVRLAGFDFSIDSTAQFAPLYAARAAPVLTEPQREPWDLLEADLTGSNVSGSLLSSLEAAALLVPGSVRTASHACNVTFFDLLRVVPPLHECSALELSSAISKARRSFTGAPLVVPGCRLQWYQGDRACDLLQSVGGLDVRGDSLSRHVIMATVELLIGDLANATHRHLKPPLASICECNGAYDDGHANRYPGGYEAPNNKYCRVNTVAALSFEDLRKTWPGFCPRWGTQAFIHRWIDEGHGVSDRRARGAIAVLQGGLHQGALNNATAQLFYGPNRLSDGNAPLKYVYMALHAPYGIRRENTETNPVLVYNDIVRSMAVKAGSSVLDAYAVTVGEVLTDNIHYPKAPNIVLAQLLLNLVAAIGRELNSSRTQ